MPSNRSETAAELIRQALASLDVEIAELQRTRAQVAALIEQPAAAPPKPRKAAVRSARTKKKAKPAPQKPKPAATKAKPKAKPAKARPAPAKKKKSPMKKAASTPPAPQAEAEPAQAA